MSSHGQWMNNTLECTYSRDVEINDYFCYNVDEFPNDSVCSCTLIIQENYLTVGIILYELK